MQKQEINSGNNEEYIEKYIYIIAWERFLNLVFLNVVSELHYITLLLFLFLAILFLMSYFHYCFLRIIKNFSMLHFRNTNTVAITWLFLITGACCLSVVLPTFALVFLSLLIKISAMFFSIWRRVLRDFIKC